MSIRAALWGRLLGAVAAIIVFLYGPLAHARSDDDSRGFVDSIAAAIYHTAWPTATYEGVSIKSIEPAPDGRDILVKLSGKSGWNDGDLWMIVTLQIRNGSLNDIKVQQHNAILSPPFATAKALGKLLVELAEGNSTGPTSHRSGIVSGTELDGYRLHVSNKCSRSLRLAIKYLDTDDRWRVLGWWKFNPRSSSFLAFESGEFARTKSSVLYYYAESEDGTLYWGGEGNEVILDGRKLPMARLEDKSGDTEWSLQCDN